MRQRLNGDHVLGFRFLPLVKSLCLRVEAKGEIRRLNKEPSQILVAVPSVSLAFFPAVARVRTVHAAGVGCEVADIGKALYRPRFQNQYGTPIS